MYIITEFRKKMKDILKKNRAEECSDLELCRKIKNYNQYEIIEGCKRVNCFGEDYFCLKVYDEGAKLITALYKDDGYTTVKCWIFNK